MRSFLNAAMDFILSERQKQVVELYYIEGRKMPEIAQLLGVNKSTVSITIKRALKNIEKNKKIFEKVVR